MFMQNVLGLLSMNFNPTGFESQQTVDLVFVHSTVGLEIILDVVAVTAFREHNNEGRLGVGFLGLFVSTELVRCGDAVNASLSPCLEQMASEILQSRV